MRARRLASRDPASGSDSAGHSSGKRRLPPVVGKPGVHTVWVCVTDALGCVDAADIWQMTLMPIIIHTHTHTDTHKRVGGRTSHAASLQASRSERTKVR